MSNTQKTFAYVVIKDRNVRNSFFNNHVQRASDKVGYTRYANSIFFTFTFSEHGEKISIKPTNMINIGKHVALRQCHLDELALIPDEAVHSYLSTFIRK